MSKGLIIILVGLVIYGIPSYGQLAVKDFKFNSWFGSELNGKEEIVYSLLGTGFFRTPRADNTDSVISNWLSQHPGAWVLPVYTSGPTMTDSKDSKMVYSWIGDNKDTLNILLVRRGCVPGGTMQRPKTWDEMSDKEKKMWYDDIKHQELIHVDGKIYKEFLDKVIKAEAEARHKKLGIWTEKKD